MTGLTEPQSREIAYLDRLARTAQHYETASATAVLALLLANILLGGAPDWVQVAASIAQIVAVIWWLTTHDRAKDAKWRADAHRLAAANYRFGYRDGSAAKLDESHPCK